MRERSLGIKIPPTNLKPDFGDQAEAFANKLADTCGPAPAARAAGLSCVRAELTGSMAGLLAALAIGATACFGRLVVRVVVQPTTTSTSSPVASVGKRGVVTIPMATVGDPGNPSVGVWQVFKTAGTKGAGVDSAAHNGTGIYKSCARRAQPRRRAA